MQDVKLLEVFKDHADIPIQSTINIKRLRK
jgi:hypothetical protein